MRMFSRLLGTQLLMNKPSWTLQRLLGEMMGIRWMQALGTSSEFATATTFKSIAMKPLFSEGLLRPCVGDDFFIQISNTLNNDRSIIKKTIHFWMDYTIYLWSFEWVVFSHLTLTADRTDQTNQP